MQVHTAGWHSGAHRGWHSSPHSWNLVYTAGTQSSQLAGSPNARSWHSGPYHWLALHSSQLAGNMVHSAHAPAHTDGDSIHTAGWNQVLTADTHFTQLVPPRAPVPAGELLPTVPCSLPWSLCWPLNTPQMTLLFLLNKTSFNYTERESGKTPSRTSQPEEFKI